MEIIDSKRSVKGLSCWNKVPLQPTQTCISGYLEQQTYFPVQEFDRWFKMKDETHEEKQAAFKVLRMFNSELFSLRILGS